MENGKVQWKSELVELLVTVDPVLHDNGMVVMIGADYPEMMVLAYLPPADSKPVWSVTLNATSVSQLLSGEGVEGAIYMIIWDHVLVMSRLLALSSNDGKLIWGVDMHNGYLGLIRDDGLIACADVQVDSTLMLVDYNGSVVSTADSFYPLALSLNHSIIANTTSGAVVKLNSDLSVAWMVNISSSPTQYTTATVDSQGLVYASAVLRPQGWVLVCINESTGEKLWELYQDHVGMFFQPITVY